MNRKKGIADFVRMPATVEMPLSEIRSENPNPTDHRFVELYTRYLTGKLVSVHTRIDIGTITPGFFQIKDDGTYEHVGRAYEDKALDVVTNDIRRGFRPPLFLYKNFVGPEKNKLLSSDDLASFYAYSRLGIRRVPVVILGNHPECLQESGIATRGIPKTLSSKFESLVTHKHSHYISICGDYEELTKQAPTDILEKLSKYIERTKEATTSFHLPSIHSPIHYHHTLFSALCSLQQILFATKILLENDLAYQIRPLARSAYDLFLNFYIDWLYPEKMGALLQALAILSRTNKSSAEHKSLDQAVRKTFGSLVDTLTNQSEKGRISPLGVRIHRGIYSDLSPAVHQDFGVTQDFGSSLESGHIESMATNELYSTLQVLDIVVSATALRIADDVGLQLTN
ncbi:hypothetical protein AB7783_28670 [Tardiphaga sp. 172_B4_N1_3]|uniref:hypothetical protein n=1 Tax=Tardiphaga sp. 172_B4_N1_3 TaxID=3240787 RepID=UPI003F8BE055